MAETYTLEEAQRELDRRECMLHGHSWDVIELQFESIPHSVICRRCGQAYPIDRGEE